LSPVLCQVVGEFAVELDTLAGSGCVDVPLGGRVRRPAEHVADALADDLPRLQVEADCVGFVHELVPAVGVAMGDQEREAWSVSRGSCRSRASSAVRSSSVRSRIDPGEATHGTARVGERGDGPAGPEPRSVLPSVPLVVPAATGVKTAALSEAVDDQFTTPPARPS
jgi:hypothetical protein